MIIHPIMLRIFFSFFVQKYSRLPTYPVYGTLNDTKEYFLNYIDPSFNLTTALTRVLCDIILRLSDSAILPYNISAYQNLLYNGLDELKDHSDTLNKAGINLGKIWILHFLF